MVDADTEPQKLEPYRFAVESQGDGEAAARGLVREKEMTRVQKLCCLFAASLIAIFPIGSFAARFYRAPWSMTESCIRNYDPTTCRTEELAQALVSVIRSGSEEDFRRPLDRLGDAEFEKVNQNARILSWAVSEGRPKMVAALLGKGANPAALGDDGRWFIYRAIPLAYELKTDRSKVVACIRMIFGEVAKSHQGGIAALLDATVIFPHARNTPNLDLLRLFLAYGADPTRRNLHEYGGPTPLDIAVKTDNHDAVRMMVASKVGVKRAELDRRTFEALKQKNLDLAAIFRSAGGDAGRYINANPTLLFDAASGDVETLAFLLKNGGNPNVVDSLGTPLLFAGTYDLQKAKLLLKYSADPKARNQAGMTALAYVLSRPISRPRSATDQATSQGRKIGLVKLLLAHKSELNGDNGGAGRWGALGATRKEEPEIINFLIHRGATLDYRVGGPMDRFETWCTQTTPGPITLALDCLKRDDLALALLNRDSKVGANDRNALLYAVRSGYTKVAKALLRIGANPNVADVGGITPLAIAERRKDKPLIEALLAAGAKPVAQPATGNYPTLGWNDFEVEIAAAIDKVALFDAPRFFPVRERREGRISFSLDSAHGSTNEKVECERSVSYLLIFDRNQAGGIHVAICKHHAKEIAGGMQMAQREAAKELGKFLESGPGSSGNRKPGLTKEQLVRFGLVLKEGTGPRGAKIHYFPLIAVGHGVLLIPTAVLISRNQDQVILVQADVTRLCEPSGRAKISPLCRNVGKAMIEITRGILSEER